MPVAAVGLHREDRGKLPARAALVAGEQEAVQLQLALLVQPIQAAVAAVVGKAAAVQPLAQAVPVS